MRAQNTPILYCLGAMIAFGVIAWLAYSPLATQAVADNCPGRTPAEVVQAYYTASAQGNIDRAQACLTTQYREQLRTVVDPLWQNLATVTFTRIDEQAVELNTLPDGVPRSVARATQVFLSYAAQWRVETTAQNGPALAFIYLVQATDDAPWRIASIGTGP